MPTSIKIENLSKQYRLGVIGTGTLSHDLNRWWTMNIRGKEDPYLKIGETNVIATRNPKLETRTEPQASSRPKGVNSKPETRTEPQASSRPKGVNSKLETRNPKPETRNSKLESQYVWALRDINLEIEQGDVVGIIGKNGAGKSTLLKILSRVTKPTTGSIKYNGRIASLLEVGTGFHPEMTGRENIYMNGAIMGMTRHEISSKLDEIIAFAGVERYIDTPVKRYSSGMTVRLGFSIAAHLEPDILVVDEVLAVGDAEFQKKAIGKMQDVSKGGGRTVLFVSHNMGAIQSLCTKGVLLQNGELISHSTINNIIDLYLNQRSNLNNSKIEFASHRKGNADVIFADFYVEDISNNKIDLALTGQDINLVFVLKTNRDNITNVNLDFSIHNEFDDPLTVTRSSYQNTYFNFSIKGYYIIKFKFANLNIAPGLKKVRGLILSNNELTDWPSNELGQLNIEMGDYYLTGFTGINNRAQMLLRGTWVMGSNK